MTTEVISALCAPSVRVKPVYTIREFCDEFSTSRSVAYEEIKAGRLRIFKNGASTRITGEAAMAWRNSKLGLAA